MLLPATANLSEKLNSLKESDNCFQSNSDNSSESLISTLSALITIFTMRKNPGSGESALLILDTILDKLEDSDSDPLLSLISNQVVRRGVDLILGKACLPVGILDYIGIGFEVSGTRSFYDNRISSLVREQVEREFSQQENFEEPPIWEEVLTAYHSFSWIPLKTKDTLDFVCDEVTDGILNFNQYLFGLTGYLASTTKGKEIIASASQLVSDVISEGSEKDQIVNSDEIDSFQNRLETINSEIKQYILSESKLHGIEHVEEFTLNDSEEFAPHNTSKNLNQIVENEIIKVNKVIKINDECIREISNANLPPKENIIDMQITIKVVDCIAKTLLDLNSINRKSKDFRSKQNLLIKDAKRHLEEIGVDLNLNKIKNLAKNRTIQLWEIEDCLHQEINEAGSTYRVLQSFVKKRQAAQHVLNSLMELKSRKDFYGLIGEQIEGHISTAEGRQARLIKKLNHIRFNQFLPIVSASFRLISAVTYKLPFKQAKLVSASASLSATLIDYINEGINHKKMTKFKNLENLIKDNSLHLDLLSTQYQNNANLLQALDGNDKALQSSSGKLVNGAEFRKILQDRLDEIPVEMQKLITAAQRIDENKSKNQKRIQEIQDWLAVKHSSKDEKKRDKCEQELANLLEKNITLDSFSEQINTTSSNLSSENNATEQEKEIQDYIKPIKDFYDVEYEEFVAVSTGMTNKQAQDKIIRLRNQFYDCLQLFRMKYSEQDQAVAALTQGPASIFRILANYSRYSELQTLTTVFEKGSSICSAASLSYRMYRICHELFYTVDKVINGSEKTTGELFTISGLINVFANPISSLIHVTDSLIQVLGNVFFGIEFSKDLTLERLGMISNQLSEIHKDIIKSIQESHVAFLYELNQKTRQISLAQEATQSTVEQIYERQERRQLASDDEKQAKSRKKISRVIDDIDSNISCKSQYSENNINRLGYYLDRYCSAEYTRDEDALLYSGDFSLNINFIKDKLNLQKSFALKDLCNIHILIAVNTAIINLRKQSDKPFQNKVHNLLVKAKESTQEVLVFLKNVNDSNRWLCSLVDQLQNILFSIQKTIKNYDLEKAITPSEISDYQDFVVEINKQSSTRAKNLQDSYRSIGLYDIPIKRSNHPARIIFSSLTLNKKLQVVEKDFMDKKIVGMEVDYQQLNLDIWSAYGEELAKLSGSNIASMFEKIEDSDNKGQPVKLSYFSHLNSTIFKIKDFHDRAINLHKSYRFKLKPVFAEKFKTPDSTLSLLESLSAPNFGSLNDIVHATNCSYTVVQYCRYISALISCLENISKNPADAKISWHIPAHNPRNWKNKSFHGHYIHSVSDKTVPLVFPSALMDNLQKKPQLDTLNEAVRLKLVAPVIEYSLILNEDKKEYLLSIEYSYVKIGEKLSQKIAYGRFMIARFDYLAVHALSKNTSTDKSEYKLQLNYFLVEAMYGGKLSGKNTYDLTQGAYFTPLNIDIIIPDYIHFNGLFDFYNENPNHCLYFESSMHFDRMKGKSNATQHESMLNTFHENLSKREQHFDNANGKYLLEHALSNHKSILTKRMLKTLLDPQIIKMELNRYSKIYHLMVSGIRLCTDLDYFSICKLLIDNLHIIHPTLLLNLAESDLDKLFLAVKIFDGYELGNVNAFYTLIKSYGNTLRAKLIAQDYDLKCPASELSTETPLDAITFLGNDLQSKRRLLSEISTTTRIIRSSISQEYFATSRRPVNFSEEYIRQFRIINFEQFARDFYDHPLEKIYSISEFSRIYDYIQSKFSNPLSKVKFENPKFMTDEALSFIDNDRLSSNDLLKFYPLTNGLRWYLLVAFQNGDAKFFALIGSSVEEKLALHISNKLKSPRSSFLPNFWCDFYQPNANALSNSPASYNAITILECIERLTVAYQRFTSKGNINWLFIAARINFSTRISQEQFQQILIKHKYYLFFNHAPQPEYIATIGSEFFAHFQDFIKCSKLMTTIPLNELDLIFIKIQKERNLDVMFLQPITIEEFEQACNNVESTFINGLPKEVRSEEKLSPVTAYVDKNKFVEQKQIRLSTQPSVYTQPTINAKERTENSIRFQNYIEIKQYLSSTLNMPILANKGDGACLFRALVQQLNMHSDVSYTHKDLRKQTVNYVEGHLTEFESFFVEPNNNDSSNRSFSEFNNINEWLSRMSNKGTYGDNLAVKALSEVLQRDILILSPTVNQSDSIMERISITSICKNSLDFSRALILLYNGSNHYETVEALCTQKFTTFINAININREQQQRLQLHVPGCR